MKLSHIILGITWLLVSSYPICPLQSDPTSYLQALPSTNELRLSAEPKTIQAGDTVTLTWHVPSANSAFMTGIGRVSPNGSTKIQPSHTTKYTLISEGPNGIQTDSAEVQVTGSRGDSNSCPGNSSEQFRFPITYKLEIPSLITYLDKLHRVLQDTLTLSVEESEISGQSQFRFVTSCAVRTDLVDQLKEPQIGFRRVAYLVEVQKIDSPTLKITVTIKTLVEYRRRIESTWRIQGDVPRNFYSEEAARLRTLIEDAR
jgi:hypothetical protein